MDGVRGFTLVELLVALALLAIIFAFAAPSLSATLHRSELTNVRSQLLASLNYAREQAVVRRRYVTVCAGSGNGCEGEDWEKGWLIYIDVNGDKKCPDIDGDLRCDDDGGEILKVIRPQAPRSSVRGNHNIARAVRYDPFGFSRFNNGTFSFCLDGIEPIGLVVSNSGRPRMSGNVGSVSCP